VAAAGDTNGDGYADIVIGARLYDSGQNDEGGAWIHLGGAAGIANGSPATATTTLQSNQAGAYFGAPVAGAGDVNGDGFDDVLVGAVTYDSGQTDEGAAFVFPGSASGVASGSPATAATTIQSDQNDALLGVSVDGAGDVNGDGYDDIVVGAHVHNSSHADEGVALLFLGRSSGIASANASTALVALHPRQGSAQFGVSVAGAGDVNRDGFADVAAGAVLYDAGQTDEGAAFVYLGDGDGLRGYPGASAALRGGQTGSSFGGCVASAGDVNGDGFDDVVVGASNYDFGHVDEGAAFIFHGSASGISSGDPAVAVTTLQADQHTAYFGISVAGAGDVNGDGFDDVVVGEPSYDIAVVDGGAAFVFLGGPNGVASGNPATAHATVWSAQGLSSFGYSVAGAGDVNNDGYADVVVGALEYDSSQPNEGAAFVFHGSVSGIGSGGPGAASSILLSGSPSAWAGYSVDGAGDVNGDGYDDVVVGAPTFGGAGGVSEGRVLVFLGGFGGVNTSAASSIRSGQLTSPTAQFGYSVAGAGDVNSDGYGDVIVGSPAYTLGQTQEGVAFVFHGGPGGITATLASGAATRIESDGSSGMLASFVAGAGDVNGDGFDDIVIAGRNFTTYGRATALVYLGSVTGIPSGTPLTAVATISAVGTAYPFVAGAGDVDNDGFDDIVLGCSNYSNVIGSEGGAFVYHVMRPEVAGGTDTVGIYIGSSGSWFLRNTNAPGGADVVFGYGPSGLGWIALSGDWDGDGDDTPALYDPSNGFFFLRNSNSPGPADTFFGFGPGGLGWKPIAGDWDGDGDDTIGLYDPGMGFFYIRNQNAPGGADSFFGFGPGGLGWVPVVGDWDGDGDTTVGLYDPSSGFFYLRNQNAPGGADSFFGFGPGGLGWRPVIGDWDGDGDDTIGLYDPSSGFFYLRNQNAPGGADTFFGYGPPNVTPLVGDWDGL
jgi:hypothetical protein